MLYPIPALLLSSIPSLVKNWCSTPIRSPSVRSLSATTPSIWWNSARWVASSVSFLNTRSMEKYLTGLNFSWRTRARQERCIVGDNSARTVIRSLGGIDSFLRDNGCETKVSKRTAFFGKESHLKSDQSFLLSWGTAECYTVFGS